MKKLIFLIIISTFLTSCHNKKNELNFEVFQFQDKDSTKGHFSKSVKFNENGQIIFEKLNDYFDNGIFRTSDEEINYYYRDKLLIQILAKFLNSYHQDSSRTEYFYNEKNLLMKKINFLKVRLRKNDGYEGCLVDSSSFEKEPKWILDYTEIYKYDKKDRLIEKYIPEHFKGQNRFEYEYDTLNRIIKETSYNEQNLVQEKKYEYKIDGYNLVSKGGWTGNEQFSFIKNENGKILQELKKWEGVQQYRIEKKYDIKNRIIIEKFYNEKDELELTHIYKYEK